MKTEPFEGRRAKLMRNRRLDQPAWVGKFATWLLRSSLDLAPAQVRPWGDGMLAELRFVEGSWASLSWAVGGTCLLLKHSLISFFAGSGGGSAAREPLAGFDEEGGMKKLAAWVAGLSAAMSLLLLLSPVFRQGLRVVESSWRTAFSRPLMSERERKSLAQRARAEHDARTLAFLALQSHPTEESVRLADEAVKLDPGLTWVYASLEVRHRKNPESDRWVEQLNQWDPDNAVPKLVVAGRICDETFLRVPFGQVEASLAANRQWRDAMAAAFRSPRYDSYFGKLFDLDRDVMTRRGLDQPMAVMGALAVFGFPNLGSLQAYEKILLAEGKKFESAGDLKRASESYWTVVRFAQLMQLHSSTDLERLVAAHMLAEGSAPLKTIAQRQGATDESAALAYQVEQWSTAQESWWDDHFWREAYLWNARIAGDSSLVLVLSLGLVLVSVLYLGIRRLRSLPSSNRRLRLAQGMAVAGAAGLLVSSLTLFLSYRPFAEIYSHFLEQRGAHGVRSMTPFFDFWGPSTDIMRFVEFRPFAVSFWYAFIAAGLIALTLMTKRLVQRRLKPKLAG